MTSNHLARDLGHVLDDLLEHSTQAASAQLAAHDLRLDELRILRLLDRTAAGERIERLTAALGLTPSGTNRSLSRMRDRGLLLSRSGDVIGLTGSGRALARELENARQDELATYVDDLPHAERLRLEAAVHLLSGELSGKLAAA